MKNKKVLVAIIIVLILVIAAVAGILILKPFDKDKDSDEEKKAKNETVVSEEEKKVAYEEILKAFAEACRSDEAMEDFVDEYVDLKSVWAAQNSADVSDFMDVYDEAEESDFEDEDFIADVKDTFLDYVEEDTEIEISDVEEDGDFSSVGIEAWKVVNFTAVAADDEIEMAAIFCEDKLVIIATPDVIDLLREDEEDIDTYENKDDDTESTEQMSTQEIEMFNSQFESYEGTAVKGTSVKTLIQTIISVNKQYEDEGIFVSVDASEISGFDSSELESACMDEDVDTAATELSTLNTKITAAKNYEVSFSKDSDGRINEITIK